MKRDHDWWGKDLSASETYSDYKRLICKQFQNGGKWRETDTSLKNEKEKALIL